MAVGTATLCEAMNWVGGGGGGGFQILSFKCRQQFDLKIDSFIFSTNKHSDYAKIKWWSYLKEKAPTFSCQWPIVFNSMQN